MLKEAKTSETNNYTVPKRKKKGNFYLMAVGRRALCPLSSPMADTKEKATLEIPGWD